MAIKKEIWIFGGDKGGVGKTKAACAFADSLMNAGVDFLPVDADPANADFFPRFPGAVNADLKKAENWGLILRAPKNLVINLPADGGAWIAEHAAVLGKAMALAGARPTYFFLCDRDPEVLKLLQSRAMPLFNTPGWQTGRLVVTRNLHFGEATQFDLLNGLMANLPLGTKVVDFPKLDEYVARLWVRSAQRPTAYVEQMIAGGGYFLEPMMLQEWAEAAGLALADAADYSTEPATEEANG